MGKMHNQEVYISKILQIFQAIYRSARFGMSLYFLFSILNYCKLVPEMFISRIWKTVDDFVAVGSIAKDIDREYQSLKRKKGLFANYRYY